MRAICITILIILIQTDLLADIQWASKVSDYSSQLGEKEYSASQVLGQPSVIADFGYTPCAWTPSQKMNPDGEFIHVEFDQEMKIKQLVINEVYNPGSIKLITAYNSKGVSETIFENNNPKYIGDQGRVFRVILKNGSTINVKSVKVELSTLIVPDYNQIDAIGISNDAKPIDISISYFGEENLSKQRIELGNNLNSYAAELIPIISADGNEMYFTRTSYHANKGNDKKSDVWYSKKDSTGKFQKPINLDYPINNEHSNFALSLSQDGNVLLLGNVYNADGSMGKGLSYSRKIGKNWIFPQELNIESLVNESKSSSYAFGSNGKTLLMSIQNQESHGGLDLYVSFLNDNGTWTKPMNLGDDINTAANEGTPFLSADGKTLFFSSSGYPGYGGQDLFYSKRLTEDWTQWSYPVNLGSSINSKGWDLYFTINAKGDEAYFVSTYNSRGREDIFKIELPSNYKPGNVRLVQGRVLDSETQKPIAAKIIYERLSDGKELGIARTNDETGEFKIALSLGENYVLLVEADKFISISKNLDLTDENDFQTTNLDLFLAPLRIGQIVQLNNIFFEFASHELIEKSHSELDRVVKLMKKYPEIKIEISGHTDNIGKKERNQKLSKRRAQSVTDYLIKNGISESRIITKGFGVSRPLVKGDSEQARQKNRRVEFKILE